MSVLPGYFAASARSRMMSLLLLARGLRQLAVLSQLEATVPMRDIVRSAMPGALR